jgi:tetratricopeptide (TPR) repeat protein
VRLSHRPRGWPADEAATRAIAAAPRSAQAHSVKAEGLGVSNRFDAALASYDSAIALDHNYATAYVGRARNFLAIGRAADAWVPVEQAIRLSPRAPELYVWYVGLCHANTHWAHDAQAIDGCLKSMAPGKTCWCADVDLTSADAWRGQNAEAATAVAELLTLRPGYMGQQLPQEGGGHADHPTFCKAYQRIIEGARPGSCPTDLHCRGCTGASRPMGLTSTIYFCRIDRVSRLDLGTFAQYCGPESRNFPQPL